MHESGHIGGFLEDLGIRTVINKVQQVVKNLLYVLYLLKVACYECHLGDKFLLFGSETLFKVVFKLLLLFFKLLL